MPDRSLAEEFAVAMSTGDESAVRGLLRSDAVVIIDSGGLVPAVTTPVTGRGAVAAALAALVASETSVGAASINGAPGVVLSRDGIVVAAVTTEVRAGLLSTVWVVRNPEKLRHWNGG